MTADNVIHLAFKSPHVEDDAMVLAEVAAAIRAASPAAKETP